jgi:hypothetical protein
MEQEDAKNPENGSAEGYEAIAYGALGEQDGQSDSMSDEEGNGYASLEAADGVEDGAEDWGDFESAGEGGAAREEPDPEAERIAARLLARMTMDYRITSNAQVDAEEAAAAAGDLPRSENGGESGGGCSAIINSCPSHDTSLGAS